MLFLGHVLGGLVVALLAEGVDRNAARAAMKQAYSVALLAEGVDRNLGQGVDLTLQGGRPPRGGRG